MARSFVFRGLFVALAMGTALVGHGAVASDKANPAAQRIVSVGGTITEILYALGAQDRIVARDSTSYFPAAANAKPDVGYMRALSAEGVLGQKPDLILMEEGSGPPPVIEILKASEVPVVVIPNPPDVNTIGDKIRAIGAAVGETAKSEPLAAKTEESLKALVADVAKISASKKNVLFILSLSNGRIMAGGTNTLADAVIALAGAKNAAASVSGYKPLSDEAVIAAQPDIVLTMDRGAQSLTPEQVFATPSMQATPAAANKALVKMDGLLLLGFGPRTPEAGRQLASEIYPGAIK